MLQKGWRYWALGLWAAIVNGFASGVVLVIVDPHDFNLYDGRGKLLATSATLGLLGAANFLKQHPIPEWDGDERREGVADRRDP